MDEEECGNEELVGVEDFAEDGWDEVEAEDLEEVLWVAA